MRKRPGFMMYDLIIAMIVGSLAITVAINLPITLVKFLGKFQSKVSQDIDLCKVINLLDQDISTIFIPQTPGDSIKNETLNKNLEAAATPQNIDKEESSQPPKTPQSDVKNKDNDSQKSTSKEKPDLKNKPINIAHDKKELFFILKSSADNNLDFLFFVNTHPFESKKDAKSKIARVIYRLEKTKTNEKILSLYRYELDKKSLSPDESIDFNLLKNNKVLILSNITKLSIELLYFEDNKQPIIEQTKEPTTPTMATLENNNNFSEKTSTTWPLEKNNELLLPHKVKISCNFDTKNTQESLDMTINIMSAYKLDRSSIKRDL